jgi:hypothetical protein
MKHLFVTLVAAAALAAAFVATSGTAASGQVTTAAKRFVTSDCDNSAMRPRNIDLLCQFGDGELRKLDWRRWGGARAKGKGKYTHVRRSCFPRCGRSRLFPVRVTLSKPRPCPSARGKQHYRKVVFRFTDGKPKGVNRRERQRINCPF